MLGPLLEGYQDASHISFEPSPCGGSFRMTAAPDVIRTKEQHCGCSGWRIDAC